MSLPSYPSLEPTLTLDAATPGLVNAAAMARVVAKLNNLPVVQVRRVIASAGDFAAFCLANGHAVRLPGLGDIKPKDRPPRAGRGLNGQPYAAPARRGVTFRAGKALKDALAKADNLADPTTDD